MLLKIGTLPLFLALAVSRVAAQEAGPLPEPAVRYDSDLPSADFHRGRREAVLEALPRGTVAVVVGGVGENASPDDLRAFVQDPDFYYLTGSEEPGSSLLLAPDGIVVDGRRVREVLLVAPRDPAEEIWLGRRFGAARAQRELGVRLAVDNTRFDEIVGALVSDSTRRVLSQKDRDVRTILDGLRMVKTEEEVAMLRRAAAITGDAHRQALGSMKPGWTEYQIEALVEYTFARSGAERPGFPSIVGSGENAVLLHYDTNRRTTREGDLVVVDVGASYHGYTADVTRTYPVNGAFTADQRAIYDVVLEAQKAGIDAVRVGASFGAPGHAASRVLARGLARLGIIAGPNDVTGLARFFPHSTSHYLGLQVHDVGAYGRLVPGVVVTVEPGIYIAPAEDVDARWWNIGVRIEDDVLVTALGPVVLSASAPKDPTEIERTMRSAVTR